MSESAWGDVTKWARSVASMPKLLRACAFGLLHRPADGSRVLRDWCTEQCALFGIQVHVDDANDGHYDDGPYIFVQLNQSSLSETFALPAALPPIPFAIVMNIEYALLPFVGWTYAALGSAVIVRQWPAQARRALGRVRSRLEAGGNVAMSIEGRRSPDGRLQPYKKGPIVLALEAGATIVPVALHGTHACLPVGAWRVRPGDVHVHILPAISTRGLTLDDRDALLARLRALGEAELGVA